MKQIGDIVDRQIREWELRRGAERDSPPRKSGPVICISRDIGAGGRVVAGRLATELGCDLLGKDTVDFVARDLKTQKRMIDTLDEKGKESLERWIDGYLHWQPVEFDEYGRSMIKVVRTAALQGNVIFLGRGASFILGLDEAFSVRLVAPVEQRVKNLMKYESIGEEEAQKKIHETDAQRNKFIQRVFHRDPADPLAYHLTINTANLDEEAVIRLILFSMKIAGFLKDD